MNLIVLIILYNFQGFDATTKFKQIMFYTSSSSIREFLISELLAAGKLTDEEKHLVDSLHLVQQLYPVGDFEKVATSISQESNP